jgi:hypothetical protein
VNLTVRLPSDPSRELRGIQALVDTGADITLLPAALIAALRPLPWSERFVIGVGGIRAGRALTYFLEFELGGHRDMIEVLGFGDEAIAGRNWLNSFEMTLDGPGETVTVHSQGSAVDT